MGLDEDQARRLFFDGVRQTIRTTLPRYLLLIVVATLGVVRPARADLAPPPTGMVDFIFLDDGGPMGIIVGGLLIAGAILLFLRLRRRGRSVAFAGGMAALLFVGGNLVCWVSELSHGRERRARARDAALLAHPYVAPLVSTAAAPGSLPSATSSPISPDASARAPAPH